MTVKLNINEVNMEIIIWNVNEKTYILYTHIICICAYEISLYIFFNNFPDV